MAFCVEEEVGWFQISVKNLSGVEVLKTLEQLVDDVLLVDGFQDVGSYDSVQVGVHEVEDQINVFVVLSPNGVLQSNDVFMSS